MVTGESKKTSVSVAVDVDCTSLDEAIEKTNRLVELLREASDIISTLGCGRDVDACGSALKVSEILDVFDAELEKM